MVSPQHPHGDTGDQSDGTGAKPHADVEDVLGFLDGITGPSAVDAGGDVVARLCRACVDLLDVTGASVSLSGDEDSRALWWSSDETAGRLAEAQYSLGVGPCRSALELVSPVLAADLAGGSDAERWPVFAQQALDLGVRAVFSLPLSTGGSTVGTLDLYRSEPGPLSAHDRAVAFPVADAITHAFLALEGGPGDGRGQWLDAAENDHEEVHQATGMLMVLLGLDAQQALARLRAHAFTRGQSVTEAARDIVTGKESLSD
ncbi:GAF and ANTAR domain-containing protein [Streptomyces sp. NPDC051578]|uniref:GAF and ANTAR domain-containing protein n=1 Tax=Streptomyces sp. NPDC051578 TaxID=3365662 RepID=UPI0037BB3DC2